MSRHSLYVYTGPCLYGSAVYQWYSRQLSTLCCKPQEQLHIAAFYKAGIQFVKVSLHLTQDGVCYDFVAANRYLSS